MSKFFVVAMGGTFDVLHKGHVTLLSKAFEVSDKTIIGLTSDRLALKKGKKLWNNYSTRMKNLIALIEKKFPNSNFHISKLDDDFGPAVLKDEVEALVVSEETAYQIDILNQQRKEKNLPPVHGVIVPMVMAEDGTRISSTRIRNSEIDSEGKTHTN
ncbi:MAG: pantetheine-phosphate adenylyltransferase [Nitrosopumilaceae archaeon]|nr:pantetheine-phosphate adenylyltransferase [Nitrosopumilaceae archaeon]